MQIDENSRITVLCCRGEAAVSLEPIAHDEVPGEIRSGDVGMILAACGTLPIHVVGRRPGKVIDSLLRGRVLVVGDDADLNAVVLRLLRKELLGSVEVAFAAAAPTAVTDMYGLPTGAEAVRAARLAEVDRVPLVRNDAGGVLVGAARLGPVTGTFYVDEERIPGGTARSIEVVPGARKGLAVTVVKKRFLGFGRLPVTYEGRAVEFGILPNSGTVISFDGIVHPREVQQWVFYAHTEPWRLVRGAY